MPRPSNVPAPLADDQRSSGRRDLSALVVGLLVFLVSAVLPLSALLLAGRWASTEVEARTLAGALSTADAVAGQAAEAHDSTLRVLSIGANRLAVQSALLGGDSSGVPAALESIYATGSFSSVGLFDASGVVIAESVTGSAPRPDSLSRSATLPVSYPVVREGRRTMQPVVVPIRERERLLGYLTGDINLSRLISDPSRLTFGGTGKSLIVSTDGIILVHPDADIVGTLLKSPVNLGVARRQERTTLTIYSTGLRAEVVEAYAPLPGQPWGVLTSQTEDEAFAGVRDLNDRLRVLAAAAAGLGLLLAASVSGMLWRRDRRIWRQAAALTSAQQMFRSAFADAPAGVAIVGLDGRFLQVNGSLCELVGHTEDELLETTFSDLTHPDERAAGGRVVALGAGPVEGAAQERRHLRADGTLVWMAVDVSAVSDERGAATHFVAHFTDITERRAVADATLEANRQLELARDAAVAATQAKSAFLATMSHEIRTPMNAVIGMTGLLLDTDLDPVQRDFTLTVRDSGDALLTVINDILDFSKIESGQLELEVATFDLRDCVESALSVLAVEADAKGLELVADLDDSCPDVVVGDASRLRQVLVNLVSNAVKFTAVGEVVVVVRAEHSGSRDSGTVQLLASVRDTGIGIPAGKIDRLFQAFSQVDASTTRRYGGTGLGLVISRRLVQAMGGDLTVTSLAGLGSTFSFTAMLRASPERRSTAERRLVGSLRGRTALLVDDNATNRRVLRLQLERWGIGCTDVETPAEALMLVRDGATFDVAVLDMHMPDMDGASLAVALRALPGGRHLPLVLLSSMGTRLPARQQALFVATLTKPAKSSLLQSTLLQAVVPAEAALLAVETAGGRRHADAGRASTTTTPSLRVLLAEDNLVNQKVAQLMLAKLGHHVDTVSNGLEAVEAVHRTAYDVVLMDVQMPVLDGLAAARRIRDEMPGSRPAIVAVTASALVEDRTACADAGMDAYLAKPVRSAELAAVLADVGRHLVSAGPDHGWPADVDEPAGSAARQQIDLEHERELAVRSRLEDLTWPDAADGVLVGLLLRAFVDSTPSAVRDLTGALQAASGPQLREQAHGLKGAAANLGGTRLVELLVELESAARADDLAAAGAVLPRVVTEVQDLCAVMTSIADEADPQRATR